MSFSSSAKSGNIISSAVGGTVYSSVVSGGDGGISKRNKKNKTEDTQAAEHASKHRSLKELRKRVELCQREASYKAEVMRLQDAITRAEQESWKIKEKVEKFKSTKDFEWQLEQYAIVNKLTAQITVDQEDLVFAQDKYDILHREVMEKYPELANDFLKQAEIPPEAVAAGELEEEFQQIMNLEGEYY